jgi:adenosine deaminase
VILKPELDWFERLPKVELHLHLEGAIPHDAMWELVKKYDEDITSRQMLERRFECRDLAHFLETWTWKNQFLREYGDFEFMAEAVARDLANQNIRYAEAFYSPPDFIHHGLQTQRITESIRRGLDAVDGIEIALVVDLVRDFGPAKGRVTLEEINEVKQSGVVGVGIGGSERGFPPEQFEAVFARARQLGFRTSAHAGEAVGAESIWGAIRLRKVDRIGHGTRAEEDDTLLDYIVEHEIPVEICPTSNVRTGVVESYEEHPVRRYYQRGMFLSINTDDPKMFGISLAEEYMLLLQKKGFTPVEIKKLVLGSVEMSWMPKEKKSEMASLFYRDPAWDEY